MRAFFFLLAMLMCVEVVAQEVGDSAEMRFRELSEVVVTAKRASFIENGLSVVPDRNEKKVAVSGYSLLETDTVAGI